MRGRRETPNGQSCLVLSCLVSLECTPRGFFDACGALKPPLSTLTDPQNLPMVVGPPPPKTNGWLWSRSTRSLRTAPGEESSRTLACLASLLGTSPPLSPLSLLNYNHTESEACLLSPAKLPCPILLLCFCFGGASAVASCPSSSQGRHHLALLHSFVP